MRSLFLFSFLLFFVTLAQAQTQVVKGSVVDALTRQPLIGATVAILDTDPLQGVAVDVDGKFRIEGVAVGRQNIAVQYIGYKSTVIPNVLVTAGKEVILLIELEESVEQLDEVVITDNGEKGRAINDLAKVSARTFSLEEVTRFSGGRNDVARLAASFAGVSAPDDARNDIVVRGNSPVGQLWRIEDIPVANTNHFSTLGTTGGPVNALNTNLLRTSDFLTGAFPAEYGNAYSAVFDVNFRNGNADRYEFTAQVAAFSGAELVLEGPLSRKNGSSFIAAYRYGIAGAVAPGTGGVPYYQDVSFKINLGDSKIGRFELFGMGGTSSIDFLHDEIDEDDLFAEDDVDAYVKSQIGLVGLSHNISLGKTAFLRTVIGASTNANEYTQDNFIKDSEGNLGEKFRAVNVDNRESRYTLSSTLNKKFNARWSLRAGILSELYQMDIAFEDRDEVEGIPDNNADGIPDFFVPVYELNDNFLLQQTFAQTEYKVTDDLSLTGGLHAQYHSFTDDLFVAPRAAVSWQAASGQRWSFAYGLHSQSIPTPVLFNQEEVATGVFAQTNDELDFIKSHHLVLAYDRSLSKDWRLKAEVYTQFLFDVPIEQVPSSYSAVNEGADFVFEQVGSLVNEGSGLNYGLELTLEKFFSQNYYMLATASVYRSEYEGSDGITRSTAYDNNYVFNVLLGKEWPFGKDKRNAWTFDTKFVTAGGRPFTPINVAATRANNGNEVLLDEQAFSERYDAYLRWDVKVGVRLNSKNKRLSHQFFLDIQNVLNRENELERRFNERTDAIRSVAQNGIFPDVMYRLQF